MQQIENIVLTRVNLAISLDMFVSLATLWTTWPTVTVPRCRWAGDSWNCLAACPLARSRLSEDVRPRRMASSSLS
eukprot:scaffold467330_cov31-Prasinocladus_malaysianus.AAC.1